MSKNNKINSSSNQEIELIKRRISSIEKRLGVSKANNLSEDNYFIQIPVELVNEDIQSLEYAHVNDAGFDLRADRDYYIAPGQTVLIKTGVKVAIPEGYELQIRARSGISLKTDLRLANGVGTIDSGYRGEIGILLHNTYRFRNIEARVVDIQGNKIENPPKGYPKLTYYIKKGDRIAQGVISRVYRANFLQVKDVSSIGIDRKGGFGSSGTD